MVELYKSTMISFLYRDIKHLYRYYGIEQFKRELSIATIDLGRQTGKTSAAIFIAEIVPNTVLVTFNESMNKEIRSRSRNINVTTPIKLLNSILDGHVYDNIIFDEHKFMNQYILNEIIRLSGKYTKFIKLG